MSLNEPYFTDIVQGKKIYELRIHDSKRKNIFLEDYIVFTNTETKKQIKCKVVEIILDDSFKNIIQYCKLKYVLPNIDSIENAIDIYEKIPHNELCCQGITTYKDAIRHFGAVAFKLELVELS